jgi:hypothetical protein
MNASFRKALNEKGMALITTMLIMAAAGVIAIAVSIDNTVETRIAANQKTTELAFRNAEAGLEHARLNLGGLFSTATRNLNRIRMSCSANWDFLFDSPTADVDRDERWDEKLLDLGSTNYKVFVRDSEDLDSQDIDGDHRGNGYFHSDKIDSLCGDPVFDSDQMVILRSIGFGPGGARQIVEVRVRAKPWGTHSGYYAQEGGGPTKANVNVRDRDRVDGGQISPGYTLR